MGLLDARGEASAAAGISPIAPRPTASRARSSMATTWSPSSAQRKEAVDACRAGHGPVLIEAKTMRMHGHAQHDAAEYVPKEMFEYWKPRDPDRALRKISDRKQTLGRENKKEIDARIAREFDADVEFAEESPFPPPELAEQGVYCDGCHTVEADWQRPKEEVMPPRSSVKPEWQVTDFGEFDGASAGDANPPSSRNGAESSPGNCAKAAPSQPKQTSHGDRAEHSAQSPSAGPKTRPAVRSKKHASEVAAKPAAAIKPVQRTGHPAKRVRQSSRTASGETLTMAEITDARSHSPGACSRKWTAIPPSSRIGEDVGVYGGAFKATEGLLAKFGWERVIDTPISESAIVGAACGMSYPGLRPIAEMQFIDFIACCFNQITNFVGEIALPLGRAGAHGAARAVRRRRARRAVSFGESGNVFRAHARAESGLSLDRLRRKGPAEIGDSRQQSGAVFRAQISVPPHQGRSAGGGLHGADRQGGGAARRPRPDHRQLRGHGAHVARSRGGSWRKKASRPK